MCLDHWVSWRTFFIAEYQIILMLFTLANILFFVVYFLDFNFHFQINVSEL